jgi:hypothetical protein
MTTTEEMNSAVMNTLTAELDRFFNLDRKDDHRQIGFAVMVFPFHDPLSKCDIITNAIQGDDLVALLRKLANHIDRGSMQ